MRKIPDRSAANEGASPDTSSWRIETPSGIEIRPVYRPEDLKDFSEQHDLGRPGEFPFTRGIHPTMYRGRLWTMRQYAGYGTAAESNQRYKYLLSQGQKAGPKADGPKALSVAFDLPTQIGLDSYHALAAGEVGKV